MRVRLLMVLCGLHRLLATGCHSGLPTPQSAQYTQFVQAFYVGLAAMEVGNDVARKVSCSRRRNSLLASRRLDGLGNPRLASAQF